MTQASVSDVSSLTCSLFGKPFTEPFPCARHWGCGMWEKVLAAKRLQGWWTTQTPLTDDYDAALPSGDLHVSAQVFGMQNTAME